MEPIRLGCLSLVFLISACIGPSPAFVSPCGTNIYGGYDPDGYATVESRFLSIVAGATSGDVDPKLLCKRLKDWSVDFYADSDGNSWEDTYGRGYRVLAWTICKEHLTQVANGDWRKNAIPHEWLHVYDNCTTPNHEGWEESGRDAAVHDTQKSFE